METRARRRRRRLCTAAAGFVAVALLFGCSHGASISIQAQIDQAEPGTTIQLEPGTYRENLVISKPLTLVGTTEGDRGVELIGTEPNEAAIEITSDADGTVNLRNLAVTRSNGTGITASDNAEANLEGVHIDKCISSGLSVRDNANVTATDSTFSDSDRNGVTITGNGSLSIDHCTLDSSSAVGLAAVTSSTVEMTACVIRDNGENGVTIGGDTKATLRSVQFDNNGGGKPTATESVSLGTVLTSQVGAGIWTRDRASLSLNDCRVATSATSGIAALDDSSVEIKGGEVSDNGETGLLLVSDGTHVLQDATVDGNGGLGLFLAGAAMAQMDQCVISANKYGGVALYTGSCYGYDATQSRFFYTGRLTGSGNTIPGPEEPDGNQDFGCCPASSCAILTQPAEGSTGSSEP